MTKRSATNINQNMIFFNKKIVSEMVNMVHNKRRDAKARLVCCFDYIEGLDSRRRENRNIVSRIAGGHGMRRDVVQSLSNRSVFLAIVGCARESYARRIIAKVSREASDIRRNASNIARHRRYRDFGIDNYSFLRARNRPVFSSHSRYFLAEVHRECNGRMIVARYYHSAIRSLR